jgi:UDP-glucose 4-epimerase
VETAQGAVGVFLSNAIRNKPLEIWGDGSVTRDYLYISDVAEAFARAVDYDGPQSVFNISSGVGTSLNGIIAILERILGREVVRHYQPARPFDVPVSVLDNSLARQEWGWEPRVKLEEGIVKTADWMRKALNK